MLRVIVVEPEGDYNLGFIARLCKNFKVDELVIVNPVASIENAKPFAAKGIDFLEKKTRVVFSYNEALKDLDLTIATSSIADIEKDMLRRSIKPWEIHDFILNVKNAGIIFGRESVGLTREEIMKADLLLHIPANPEYPVLNLSHAIGIVLYEIYNHGKRGTSRPPINGKYVKLIDRYVRTIYELVKPSDESIEMYVAMRRTLVGGIRDNEQARAVVHFLRKLYVTLVYSGEDK
ncbi:tRNA (cytidine-2'-O-)-methyltransferase TrmJ [Sulfuracidifex metallicus]|uniref:tRNA (cytidine-2'-O-)-methyltransferase TrmJ n=1 Tax=Sulfuracidifex metallicus TaxID=47303 RepID=UPI002273A966|nr:tRNA (cytidine-2'-O-)-methyltransferase TrmJ [Sulfuracidifex metallicus]MCY0849185.1 tRNA (cytidine-2'-O-)-methyltransferase TrmJ [Sulfuracidifex metallicus]